MHAANATPGLPAPAAVEPELGAPPPVPTVDEVAAAPAALAVVGVSELPPHPATITPLASIAAASRHTRRDPAARLRTMPSCISVSF